MNNPSGRGLGNREVAKVLPSTRLTPEQPSARRMIDSSPVNLASTDFQFLVLDARRRADLALAAQVWPRPGPTK
jgi:hypothetical protein